jgi:hypothetical protein
MLTFVVHFTILSILFKNDRPKPFCWAKTMWFFFALFKFFFQNHILSIPCHHADQMTRFLLLKGWCACQLYMSNFSKDTTLFDIFEDWVPINLTLLWNVILAKNLLHVEIMGPSFTTMGTKVLIWYVLYYLGIGSPPIRKYKRVFIIWMMVE